MSLTDHSSRPSVHATDVVAGAAFSANHMAEIKRADIFTSVGTVH